jgi:hypothetical protein
MSIVQALLRSPPLVHDTLIHALTTAAHPFVSCILLLCLASSYCVLHPLYCVLHPLTVSCILCTVSCILLLCLASSYCVLHPLYCVLHPLTVSCILLLCLASSYCVLHPLTVSCILLLCLASSVLCLASSYCVLHPLYCVLHPLYYVSLKVTDFGISRAQSSTMLSKTSGGATGTMPYMVRIVD